MATIGKSKYLAIGLVCLLIVGGLYAGSQVVQAEVDMLLLWEEIRQSPDPGRMLLALDYDIKDALLRSLPDEAARKQFWAFWEARPRFWMEFREDEIRGAVWLPYPYLCADYIRELCKRCLHERIAELLPEYPVMEYFEKAEEFRREKEKLGGKYESGGCYHCISDEEREKLEKKLQELNAQGNPSSPP